MKSNKVIIWILILWMAFIAIFITSFFKFQWISTNIGLCSIIVGNTVVIVLFIITYCLIDRRNIRVYDNKRKIAILLLNDAYDKCLDNIKLLENKKVRENLESKVKGDIPVDEEYVVSKFKDFPFLSDNLISQLATDGILSEQEYQDYCFVKDDHRKYVILAIAIHDYYSGNEWVQEYLNKLSNDIETAKRRINSN